LPFHERTKTWASFIRKTFPPIQIIFSSEEYGEPFAAALNARHITFDQKRTQVPVSASLIREKPFAYWNFIPEEARPYFVKKICFYGPESTGKSSAAARMAQRYQSESVPEVARELLITNDFSIDDIIRIGHAHFERIEEKLKTANKILFCDTDAITTQLYSAYYLGTVPPILFELERKVKYDLYFLFDIDVPWVSDGLRDLPHKRTEMLNLFRKALDDRSIPYILVSGDWAAREQIMTNAIDRLLR
jgi:HTH-type transcriptional regulator, transcriptional repressor of NAD biosynthesis genes